jgi:hypothetical protein
MNIQYISFDIAFRCPACLFACHGCRKLLMQSAKRAAVFDEREWRPVRPSIVRDRPSHAEWRHMIAIVMW